MTKLSNLFEKATQGKYRYPFKGMITTEDLYDLSVTQLDSIFKSLNSLRKQESEESLLKTKSLADAVLEDKIAIVTYLVEQKLATQEAQVQAQVDKAKREKILSLIADKQDQDLASKSIEELQALL